MYTPRAEPTDPIGRFLYQSGRFTESTGKVKSSAFTRDVGEEGVSMFNLVELDAGEAATLGRKQRPQETLRAVAKLRAEQITATGLSIDPDNVPERHVYVQGWPVDEQQILARRQDLALASKLMVIPQIVTTSETV